MIEEVEDLDKWLEEEFNSECLDEPEEKKDKKLTEEDIEEYLVDPPLEIDIDNLNEIELQMFNSIKNSDRIAWEKGDGIKSGFKLLDEKLSGIQPGFAILAADSNTGKSSFLLTVIYNATIHDNAYGLYFSLDDSSWDLIPRLVSASKKIPINSVRIPSQYIEFDNIIERRSEGIKEVYNAVRRFKIMDMNQVRNIDEIEEEIEKHLEYCEANNKKLFVGIDGFHDIQPTERFSDINQKYIHLSTRLNEIAEKLKVPIWCTGKLKKMSIAKARPDLNDIKYANEIVYDAKLIMVLYNEVGKDGNNAGIYFTTNEKPGKQPVLEVRFIKNKLSSYKKNLYYEFLTDYALFNEASENDVEFYDDILYSD